MESKKNPIPNILALQTFGNRLATTHEPSFSNNVLNPAGETHLNLSIALTLEMTTAAVFSFMGFAFYSPSGATGRPCLGGIVRIEEEFWI